MQNWRRYDIFAAWRRRMDPNYPYGDPPPGVIRTLARAFWSRIRKDA